MRKIVSVLILAILAEAAVFAQETPVKAKPEQGDIRVGLGWGWALGLNFDGSDGHTKPIIPIHATADYTFMTFADGQGALDLGGMFEFCNYQTWFTRENIKTTHTWTNGILAVTATARYCFWQDCEVFGRFFYGTNLQLRYEEEYSDESYASIVPHTSGPGNSSASGIVIGFGTFTGEHTFVSVEAGLGTYMTLGLGMSYRF